MPATTPRLRILAVGGNGISAFLSWRLQATHACDVTLVWRSGFESVAQYGVTFKSEFLGNERCKPRLVVQSTDEAASVQKGAFDYVLLCVSAQGHINDLANVIEAVVTPQHTCLLVHTSHSLGIESLFQQRFPKNVVLSLVSTIDIVQVGPAEFEHRGVAGEFWVGPAAQNAEIPLSIQNDMAEALAMTLSSGQVNCRVSKNILQQQFERMAGPIAFYCTSVLFETPNHMQLLELFGVRDLVSDTIDEILSIGRARRCDFGLNVKQEILQKMTLPNEPHSAMYQDYVAHRPMDIETYLGSPMRLAKEVGISTPRLQTLFAMLHHVNIANQKRPPPPPPPAIDTSAQQPGPVPPQQMVPNSPRMMMGPGSMNGGHPMRGPMPPHMRGRGGSRAPSITGGPPPGMRPRAPSGMSMNGYGGPPMHNGMPPPPRGPPMMQRRPSFESPNLDEFGHLMLYDTPSTDHVQNYGDGSSAGSDMALREREMILRQKEMALREREMAVRGGMRPRPPPSHRDAFDEDDGEDYFDPTPYRGPPVDPDNVDMMSITSRRNRKQPSANNFGRNPEMGMPMGQRRSNMYGRPPPPRHRNSARMMEASGASAAHEDILDNPLMGYSSDRYGSADRGSLVREGRESRAGSLTAARLSELQQGNGFGGFQPPVRRMSASPGNPLSPGRPTTPGFQGPNGMPNGMQNGRPSPPDMRQPVPRHPPGHGNAVAPQQVEQRAGVSSMYSNKVPPHVRSLTGSASASAGSGDSGRSGQMDNPDSVFSSQSSLGQRPPIGVR